MNPLPDMLPRRLRQLSSQSASSTAFSQSNPTLSGCKLLTLFGPRVAGCSPRCYVGSSDDFSSRMPRNWLTNLTRARVSIVRSQQSEIKKSSTGADSSLPSALYMKFCDWRLGRRVPTPHQHRWPPPGLKYSSAKARSMSGSS